MITVQQVFKQFYSVYKERYTPYLNQVKAAKDIMGCRTSDLGGHAYKCEECSHTLVRYNSCRNRHCPMCQGTTKAIWVDKRSKDILNAPYFHVVFTVPEELQPIIYQNQELLYDLMHKTVSQTLLKLSEDPKYLGAQIGFFSILHTWGQDLHYHPHIHTVVLAGGLTKHQEWRSSSRKFFIPVKVLSKKIRGKFLHHLKEYYHKDLLKFYGAGEKYSNLLCFKNLIDQCYSKKWYTYTERTFAGPLAVIEYLGNYTHRIAISNNRIKSLDNDSVTITLKDYKDDSKKKLLTLKGVEFIRRFLMHILPKGFVKIRHYGILANRNKKTKLTLSRKLTNSPIYKPKFEGLKAIEVLRLLTGKDVMECPICSKGKLKVLHSLLPGKYP